MSFYILLALLAISFVSVLATRQALTKTERLPYDVYIGFYTLTSLLGAIIIGLPSTQDIWILYSLTGGLDIGAIDTNFEFKYWFLIFSPYFIPSVAIIYIKYICERMQLGSTRPSTIDAGRTATLLVLTAMVLFCVYELYSAGLLGKTLISAASGESYRENILSRQDVFDGVGRTFFGLAYSGFPAVAAYALYRYLEDRAKKSWLLISIASSASAVYFYLSSFQKSYTLLLLILLGLVLLERRLMSYRKALVAGGALFLLLTSMNFLLQGATTLEVVVTGSNLLFRMPSSFPFYVGLYPDVMPFVGMDVGLKKFGIGPSAHPNIEVFNYMFPRTVYVQGAAPAAAHLTAYAEAGAAWSIVTLMVIGGVIGIVGKIGRYARSALVRTLFVCLCISIYYMTQSAFWLSFQGSYGFVWALLPLIAIIAVEQILTAAVLHYRRSLQRKTS